MSIVYEAELDEFELQSLNGDTSDEEENEH
jgi:hypothetical protein